MQTARLLPVFAAFLVAAAPASATQADPGGTSLGEPEVVRVEGRVMDAYMAAPIASARVEAAGQRVGTDGDGRFVLVLPAGEWTIVVESEGYASESTTTTLTPG